MIKCICESFPITEEDLLDEEYETLLLNDQGNILYIKYSDGMECLYKYDDSGNLISYMSSCGYKELREYNEDSRIIFYKNSNCVKFSCEYNEDGLISHFSDGTGFEEWYDYDDYGNIIYYRNSEGFKEWREYDIYGNGIYYRNNDGVTEEVKIVNGMIHMYKTDIGLNRCIDYCPEHETTDHMHVKYIENETCVEIDKNGNVVEDNYGNIFKSYYRWYYYNY